MSEQKRIFGEKMEIGAILDENKDLEENIKILLDHMINKKIVSSELAPALDYLGIEAYFYGLNPWDKPEEASNQLGFHYRISIQNQRTAANSLSQNPSRSRDFFDVVRDLDEVLQSLIREIKQINDPSRLSSAIITAKAYMDSYRSFLDIENQKPPEQMPSEIKFGLAKRVSKVDWAMVSETAVKLAENIARLIKLLP